MLRYNETKDEHNGCNVLITADESFNTVKVTKVREHYCHLSELS